MARISPDRGETRKLLISIPGYVDLDEYLPSPLLYIYIYIPDDFYFSIPRESERVRERGVNALFMHDFVSSFVHDHAYSVVLS